MWSGAGYTGYGMHLVGVQRLSGHGGQFFYGVRSGAENYRRRRERSLPDEPAIQQVRALPEVEVWTESLEENAMVQYKDRQAMAVIKGVDDNFEQLTSIDSLLYGTGQFVA